jgi:long-chain-fatty-acid--CoA ligase ACSBG
LIYSYFFHTVKLYCIINIIGPLCFGGQVYFAQPDALKGSLGSTLKEVHPTIFFAVPRVWEKMQERIIGMSKNNTSAVKQWLASWARERALRKHQYAQYGARGGLPLFYRWADFMVLRTIKAALGLDATRICLTSAAPISDETIWFFASLDIPIHEVFGQSECSGPHSVSNYTAWKVGYCGRPLLGTETK